MSAVKSLTSGAKLTAIRSVSSKVGIAVYFYSGSSTLWLTADQISAFAAWNSSH